MPPSPTNCVSTNPTKQSHGSSRTRTRRRRPNRSPMRAVPRQRRELPQLRAATSTGSIRHAYRQTPPMGMEVVPPSSGMSPRGSLFDGSTVGPYTYRSTNTARTLMSAAGGSYHAPSSQLQVLEQANTSAVFAVQQRAARARWHWKRMSSHTSPC